MKATLKKEIIVDGEKIPQGSEGEVFEEPENIPEYKDFYDLYVQFGNRPAIGLFQEEVSIIDANR